LISISIIMGCKDITTTAVTPAGGSCSKADLREMRYTRHGAGASIFLYFSNGSKLVVKAGEASASFRVENKSRPDIVYDREGPHWIPPDPRDIEVNGSFNGIRLKGLKFVKKKRRI